MIENSKGLLLLFRGTRDTFKSSIFRDMCSDKGSTLTIVETNDKKIFGGYTDIPWSKNPSKYGEHMEGGHNSFLFKLIDFNDTIKFLHSQK